MNEFYREEPLAGFLKKQSPPVCLHCLGTDRCSCFDVCENCGQEQIRHVKVYNTLVCAKAIWKPIKQNKPS